LSERLSRLLKKEYNYTGGDTSKLLEELSMRRTATIRRSGNASAVTVPQTWLRLLGWKEGDILLLRLDKTKGTITLQKSKFQENRGGRVSTVGQKSPVSEGVPDLNRDLTVRSPT